MSRPMHVGRRIFFEKTGVTRDHRRSSEMGKEHGGFVFRFAPSPSFPFPFPLASGLRSLSASTARMQKLHITQDDFGYWMMSLEREDGSLELMAHQFNRPDHLIEDALELVQDGTYPEAALVVSPPRSTAWIPPQRLAAGAASEPYRRPEPRKAAAA